MTLTITREPAATTSAPSRLTAVSLFAGIEGFGYGLAQAGIPVVAAVEIDEAARGVIADRYPETVLFNDVTEVTGDQLRATGFVPDRGIITAGFPCQDLSIAGRRAGLSGDRSGLYFHIVRLAMELRPKWLLLENVPGLLSSEGPDDRHRCICGWPYRWGGLHLPPGQRTQGQREEPVVLHRGRGGDGGEGQADPRVPAKDIRRAPQQDAGSDGALGRGLLMVGTRGAGGRDAGAAAPAPTAEAGAGPAGASGRGDPAVPDTSGGEDGPLDDGGNGPLLDHPPADPGAEPEGPAGGPDVRDASLPGSEAGCPACGRPVGETANGPAVGSGMGAVVRPLAELGFFLGWRVLDSQFLGVPQRRRRVFFVGHSGDGAAPVEVLLEPESSRGDPASRRTTRPGPAAVAALSASDGGADDNDDIGSLICGPLQAAGSGGRGHRVDAEGAATGHLVPISLAVAGDFSTGVDVAQTVRAANGQPGVVAVPISHDAYSRGEGVAKTASPDADGIVRLRDPGFNVGDDGDPAAAVVAAGPGAVGTATAVRRLTPTECERLQGFPDGWTATSNGQPQSDSARYRQLGNAVATPVIAWVARRLVAVDADRT